MRRLLILAGPVLALCLAPFPVLAQAKGPGYGTIVVKVPADATITIGGQVTKQTGPTRTFHTTELAPGRYQYEFTVTWMEKGVPKKAVRWVEVTPGKITSVDFLSAAERYTGFFSGANLDGWEGLIDEHWKVNSQGDIVGAAPKGLKFNTFLCSKKKYKDFELAFKVKMTKGANSGVQIRSEVEDPKTFQCKGPQCDMGQQYWGSLYGEHFGGMMKAAPKELVTKVVKEGDWNDYYIKAVGKHVTIKLNGETTVDEDFTKMPDEGIIAFQLHSGGPMEVIFSDIRFKEITKK